MILVTWSLIHRFALERHTRQFELLCLNFLGLLCFLFCHVNQCKKKEEKKKTVDCMIKVIALATASVQPTPTRWFCLLSDYCKHTYLSFLDVVLCSVLTFLHKLYVELEEWSECTYCRQESLSQMSWFIILLLNQLILF